jgi:arylsulfatase A
MKRNIFALILIQLLNYAPPIVLSKENRPNILVILCDDLGYGDLSCFGHPHINTPNLDNMASQGIRFTDFYSSAPVCSPSRVGLLTGRSPNRAGVYDWIPPARDSKPDAREQVHMRQKEITIPMLLKQAGYATAMAGKWHCNSMFNSTDQPQPGDAGFDHWMATQNNASPSHENPINFVRNGDELGEIKGYSCQIVANEGIKWIEKHKQQNPEQPFFMYLAFHEPHEPVASPADLTEGYLDIASNKKEATYYANVENVDHAVGKILEALKRLSIDENTLVIFTADNGPETLNRYPNASYSYGSPDPLRGMKLWTTDAGFRVAGIMRWPGNIQPGQTIHQPVSALDFLPTFCELAGKEPPKNVALDGMSFLPALEGKKIKRDKPLIWAYYNALNEHQVAMRDGDWKVLAKLDLQVKYQNLNDRNISEVRSAKFIDFEVYKVSEDIHEDNNLAGNNSSTVNKLKKKLEENYRELLEGSFIWTVKQ